MTEVKCKQYIKSDGLNFCMSSVCPEKDCIYALNNKLHQKIDYLEQENKELKVVKEQLKKWNDENLKRQDDMQLWIDLAEEQRKNYRSALEKIRELCIHYKNTNDKCVINCYAHFIVTDLIQNKINEVLK